jgi:hypothetical protein
MIGLPTRLKPRQFLLGVIVLATVLALALLTDQSYDHWVTYYIGNKPFELILQFLLITVIGGAVYTLLTVLKEEQTIQQLKVSAVQDFERELREIYRSIKQAKRRLRSRLRRRDSSWCATAGDFRESMNELLETQVEALKDDLNELADLIDRERTSRLKKLLKYGARYLHDVYEDFEKGRTRGDGEVCLIDDQCVGLLGFIAMADDDDADEEEPPSEADDATARMEDSGSPLEDRFDAFSEVRKQRPRQPQIAYACFRLASIELRTAAQDLMGGGTRPPARKRQRTEVSEAA